MSENAPQFYMDQRFNDHQPIELLPTASTNSCVVKVRGPAGEIRLAKIFDRQRGAFSSAQRTFIKLMAAPNTILPQVFSVGITQWQHSFLIMELVIGSPPKKFVDTGSALGAIIEFSKQLSDIDRQCPLKFINNSDLLIESGGRIRLIDNQIFKRPAKVDPEVVLPISHQKGFEFASPEVLQGKVVHSSSLVYSLACLTCLLTTGINPFQGANTVATASMHISAYPQIDGLPPRLEKLLKNCLEKEADKRLCTTIQQFITALEAEAD